MFVISQARKKGPNSPLKSALKKESEKPSALKAAPLVHTAVKPPKPVQKVIVIKKSNSSLGQGSSGGFSFGETRSSSFVGAPLVEPRKTVEIKTPVETPEERKSVGDMEKDGTILNLRDRNKVLEGQLEEAKKKLKEEKSVAQSKTNETMFQVQGYKDKIAMLELENRKLQQEKDALSAFKNSAKRTISSMGNAPPQKRVCATPSPQPVVETAPFVLESPAALFGYFDVSPIVSVFPQFFQQFTMFRERRMSCCDLLVCLGDMITLMISQQQTFVPECFGAILDLAQMVLAQCPQCVLSASAVLFWNGDTSKSRIASREEQSPQKRIVFTAKAKDVRHPRHDTGIPLFFIMASKSENITAFLCEDEDPSVRETCRYLRAMRAMVAYVSDLKTPPSMKLPNPIPVFREIFTTDTPKKLVDRFEGKEESVFVMCEALEFMRPFLKHNAVTFRVEEGMELSAPERAVCRDETPTFLDSVVRSIAKMLRDSSVTDIKSIFPLVTALFNFFLEAVAKRMQARNETLSARDTQPLAPSQKEGGKFVVLPPAVLENYFDVQYADLIVLACDILDNVLKDILDIFPGCSYQGHADVLCGVMDLLMALNADNDLAETTKIFLDNEPTLAGIAVNVESLMKTLPPNSPEFARLTATSRRFCPIFNESVDLSYCQ